MAGTLKPSRARGWPIRMKGSTLSRFCEASIRIALEASLRRRKYFRVEASPMRGSQAAALQAVEFRNSHGQAFGVAVVPCSKFMQECYETGLHHFNDDAAARAHEESLKFVIMSLVT